jgi:HEAT repeat protein
VVPALIARLEDPDPTVRVVAIHALGKFGTAAKSAVPGLQKARNDASANVRDAAAETLKKIAPEAGK